MKALRGKIVVKSYQYQKENLVITGKDGKPIELFIGKEYLENHREKNPVLAEVIDNNSEYAYIKKGDWILVHHNLLDRKEQNQYCIEYDREKGIGYFAIPASGSSIFCKINIETGEAEAVCENMIAERLITPIKTKHIIIPETVNKKNDTMVKVLKISPEIDFCKPGNKLLVYKYSDYEICYNLNKKDYSIIKVHKDDVLGVG